MSLINRLFSNKSLTIAYSFVVDDKPKFYWQARIFLLSLIHLAKVSPKNIFAHMTSPNHTFESFAKSLGIHIIFIEKWGDKKYCNKLQQIETIQLQQTDYVFLCDCDLAILNALDSIVIPKNITGKVVDIDNPNIESLKKIFDHFSLNYPKINYETLTSQPTFDGNFNGGLYGLPGKELKKFGTIWKKWVTKLLNSPESENILGKKIIHVDQISFCMALQETKSPYKKLSLAYNCPTHMKDNSILNNTLNTRPYVLHYHTNLTNVGTLCATGNSNIDQAINKVNQILESNFDNQSFWDYRYSTNPELGSGIGSRKNIAKYKLEVLKNCNIEASESILDIGCGDLEIIKHLKLKNYHGVDISNEALMLASRKMPSGHFYHFEDDFNAIPTARTVLCFDVLIHQVNAEKYFDLINLLAEKTEQTLILSAYTKEHDNSHMCFFYENIYDSLNRLDIFKEIKKIGSYRGVDIIKASK